MKSKDYQKKFVIDIDVSFDDTWMTRGHWIGVSFIIECFTATIVDFEVLSSFCYGCSLLLQKKTKNIISNEEYTV